MNRQILNKLTLSVLALSFFSCDKLNSKQNDLKIAADYLTFKGTLLDESMNALTDVEIFKGDDTEPVGLSNSFGVFNFALTDSALEKTKPSIVLHFVKSDGQKNLYLRSKSLSTNNRGTRDLGKIVLKPVGEFSGTVKKMDLNGEVFPANNARITIGRQTVFTDSEGYFTLVDAPISPTTLRIELADHELWERELDLSTTETSENPFHATLFPSGHMTGRALLLPAKEPRALLSSAHPYQRSLALETSSQISHFKMHHDLDKFNSGEFAASFRQIRDVVHYDFPGHGVHTLYFQFANKENTTTSEIYSLVVNVDIFADSTGIVIGDGTGFIESRRVMITFDVPVFATKMRCTEVQQELILDQSGSERIPWLDAADHLEFLLAISDEAPNATALREIFCQFKSDDNSESKVYKASAQLAVFPDTPDLFVIAGGQPQTNERIALLDIQVPANAHEMIVYEEAIQGTVIVGGFPVSTPSRSHLQRVWIKAKPQVFYTFQSSGRKSLYLQFRDKEQMVSPTYKQDIFVQPFEPIGEGFEINDGSPGSYSRDLILNLNPPPHAVAFHVAEDIEDLLRKPYETLKSAVPFRVRSSGQQAIYIQYQDINGEGSYIFSQHVYIDLFEQDPGSFVVNGGAPVTIAPNLILDIRPPLIATRMQVSLDQAPGEEFCRANCQIPWMPVDRQFEIVVKNSGTHTVYMRFASANDDVSPVITQNLIYDPFPPDFAAIEIEDDALTTDQRLVQLILLIPPAAYGMRVSNRISDFSSNNNFPFSAPESAMSFNLEPFAQAKALENHEVFVQFIAIDGQLSVIYRDQIQLEFFPQSRMVVTLNGGDPTTTDPEVILTLNPPVAATSMRIAESVADLEVAPALTPTPTTSFALSPSLGEKSVYVKYFVDDLESNVISDTIELEAP